jgi:hypothetical protein
VLQQVRHASTKNISILSAIAKCLLRSAHKEMLWEALLPQILAGDLKCIS